MYKIEVKNKETNEVVDVQFFREENMAIEKGNKSLRQKGSKTHVLEITGS